MLKDEVAIITGGARGFGLTTAITMAKQGCNIVIADVLEKEREEAVKEIEKEGVKALGFHCDISKYDDCAHVAEETKKAFGKIDILVNNAGIVRDDLTIKMKEEFWDLVINVNLKGAFNMTKSSIRHMTKARKGKIINVASVVGLVGNPGQANYVASKAGLIGLTKTWAKEFASRNIHVNAIAPGLVDTEITKDMTDAAKEALIQGTPLKRFGTMQEIANGILYLASPLSDYVTGVVLRVDGGAAIGT